MMRLSSAWTAAGRDRPAHAGYHHDHSRQPTGLPAMNRSGGPFMRRPPQLPALELVLMGLASLLLVASTVLVRHLL
jgi:hypothetical protein